LEIACGPGNITRYILAKRPDFRIEAIDLAPNMVELARKNNPTADFKIMDAREIDQLTGPYDAILCGFCMPYLSKADCAKLIADCAGLLDQEGIFYFSTMEGEDEQSGYESSSDGQHRAYIHYHQADYLQERLEAYNFELLDFRRQDYHKPDGTMAVDMFFIARLRQA
ncbi:MAG: class I SAM-dependent methyltransferase, partial [Saprospiraceae bacterium]